ncbi:hypothetical protein B5X24_HaOG202732 [Helicoverpa armigera]|uniref:Uncharacterized protein n=1 Tax=Helicoverpa armigera TaxID=29058 RepID=A0A2W1BYT6_HELAM|nr:hypothetical protein B5X24_HaOG202732 [Helicoverpa armigera]
MVSLLEMSLNTTEESLNSVDVGEDEECGPTRNEVNTPNIDIRLSGYDIEMCPNTEVSMCICRAIEDAIRCIKDSLCAMGLLESFA